MQFECTRTAHNEAECFIFRFDSFAILCNSCESSDSKSHSDSSGNHPLRGPCINDGEGGCDLR